MHPTRLRQWRLITGTCRPFFFSTRRNTTTTSNNNSTNVIDDDNADADATANNNGSILFLSPSNWPEPNATAAGIRTMSLLRHFSAPSSSSSTSLGSVHFGCGAQIPESLRTVDESNTIHWHQIEPNRSGKMKTLLRDIQNDHGPISAVVFDRFYAEEAFSFRIREICPDALLVLDMQDIHSLRLGRQYLVEETDRHRNKNTSNRSMRMTKKLMDKVMEYDPSLLNSTGSKRREKAYDTFLRELASVYRSDLVLVCSTDEMKLFESWNIHKRKLVPASFFCMEAGDGMPSKTTTCPTSYAFGDRKDFVTVGGFKHAPNVDAVKLLRYEIWPRIRERLPDARMHVYGAYPPPLILSMQDEKSGFIVHGQVEDIDEVLSKSRVLLAPLRFGAGVKGKIVDAWRCGCPVVTTPVGAEGMMGEDERSDVASDGNKFVKMNDGRWGGLIASDTDEFVDAAVKAYTHKELWERYQGKGSDLLNQLFNGRVNLPVVESGIRDAVASLRQRRRLDVVGALLWRGAQRSTEYFSKWIELKESLAAKPESTAD